LNPTANDVKHYRNWFESLVYVLPCRSCRENFATTLADKTFYNRRKEFKSRDNLSRFMVRLHNKVNQHASGSSPSMKEDDAIVFYNQFRSMDQKRARSMHCVLHIQSSPPLNDQRYIVDPDVAKRCQWR
jgi:hypothetical protein